MKTREFLEFVHPSDGWIAVMGLSAKNKVQKLVSSIDEALETTERFLSEGKDVYFGVAKFATNEGRTKDNVKSLKAFWLDIDCGETKATINLKTGKPGGYTTQQGALAALKDFCRVVNLQRPTIVNSGRGLHVYWVLDREVTRAEWEPIALKLRDLCDKQDLYVDNSVFEPARILRLPETLNFKSDPPLPVNVVCVGDPVSYETFAGLVGVDVKEVNTVQPEADTSKNLKREQSEFAKSMMANITNSFDKIMLRSTQGTGCNQILDCYVNRASLSEPRWFNALSVAKFCKDKDKAIHKISKDYEGYSFSETEKKIKHILGPHTCEEFEKNNPGGCEGCPHRGAITSPIQLGKELEIATEEDNIVTEAVPDSDNTITHVIPEFPYPFFRGKSGGVYFQPAESEADPECIYENDLYVVKRMVDPLLGDVVIIKVHLPRDGVREFTVPNTHVADVSELRSTLARQGILATKKKFDLLVLYIQLSIKELQASERAEKMRLQFGWADKDSKFILGDREYCADGVYHSPPSSITKELANAMVPVGTYEKWQEVFNLYGRAGLEPHAFAALTAFGSPLLKFTGQNGGLINVIHKHSGTGKTTILRMCNSVYGNPSGLSATWKDTANSIFLLLGVLNNLPFTMDEMTNMRADAFSELIYGLTQGRGRHRMKQSGNELRTNLSTWQAITLCSSNSSFMEKINTLKQNPFGEMMRLLEYKIEVVDAIEPMYAKSMFDHQLSHNYGHAAEVYLPFIVSSMEDVKKTTLAMQHKIDRELKLNQSERFWSAIVASNMTGGSIAKRLGIMDWDLKPVYEFAMHMVNESRKDVAVPVSEDVSVVGGYIYKHYDNILAVDEGVDLRTKMPKLPVLLPKGELLIRYEPDTKRMCLIAKHFKEYCVESHINYKDVVNALEKRGILIDITTKRLAKGMKIAAPGVHCLVLDAGHPEFMEVTSIVEGTNAENDN